MNTDIVIADLQGFRDMDNRFIIKEISVFLKGYIQNFLVKPPYPFDSLTYDEKKQVRWLERNRGIRWSEGHIGYNDFVKIIKPYLFNKKIITKGLEKIEWIKEFCQDCEVVDIGEMGCPNFQRLYKTYNTVNCIHHDKICALRNVLCIKEWYCDNNMTVFDLFKKI